MEYLLIIFFQLLGIGFHVGQKITSLNTLYKEQPIFILKLFISTDWPTLFVSSLVLLTDLGAHFVLDYVGADPFTDGWWRVAPFGLALFLGYAGQRVVYKLFGTTEKMLDKQIGQIESKV